VTIDQHEWYAPPQLYTRNDATGLWTAKSAISPESPFVASACHTSHVVTNSNSGASLSELSPMDLKCQYDSDNLADGCIKMQTDDEIVVDGSHSSEDSIAEKKRRRVHEEVVADGTLPSYGDLENVKGSGLRHSSNAEGSDIVRTVSSNASLAEQVIEPALVMFEVSNIIVMVCHLTFLS
jgi:pro-apoptotic serine protease NMA111